MDFRRRTLSASSVVWVLCISIMCECMAVVVQSVIMENIILLNRNEQSMPLAVSFPFLLDFSYCSNVVQRACSPSVLLCCSLFLRRRRRRRHRRWLLLCTHHETSVAKWRKLESNKKRSNTQQTQQQRQQRQYKPACIWIELNSGNDFSSISLCSLVQQQCIAILDGIRYFVYGTWFF